MSKHWSEWHKGFNDELFPAPFNLAGEPLDESITAEGEARVRALAEAEARKSQRTFSQLTCERCGHLSDSGAWIGIAFIGVECLTREDRENLNCL